MIKQKACSECGQAFEPDYADQTICSQCQRAVRCPKCGQDGTLVYAQAIYSKAPATVLHIEGNVRRTCLLRQTELAKIEKEMEP